MSAFNRNIITIGDIDTLLDPTKGTPATLDTAPPAGNVPVAPAAPAAPPAPPGAPVGAPAPAAPAPAPAPAPGGVAIPTSDDYLTKLLKYVPLEILGAYLFVESLVIANVDKPHDLQVWLFWTLAVSIVVSGIYMKTVLGVVRGTQIIMGAIGLGVYVFATGGWFATTSWYEDWFLASR